MTALQPHRLCAAVDPSPYTTLLERRLLRLERLLREAVVYVDCAFTEGAQLRARIKRELPKAAHQRVAGEGA